MASPKTPIEKYFKHMTCYHWYFFFFLFLTKFPIFWHVLNLLFLSPPMEFTCKKFGTENSSGYGDQCPCDEAEWNRSVFTETVQTKYGILCEKEWLVSFSQSMLYVGTLIGALFFGFLSDRFGRLLAFALSCVTIATAGCLVVVMPTSCTFIMMRCIEGIGVGGAIVTGYVLCVEYCGTGYREMVSALFHIPINIGHMSLAGISYYLRHCDDFQLALSIPVFFCVLVWCLLFESPKWLANVGKVERATVVMQKIAKFNRHPTDTIKTEMEQFYSSQTTEKQKQTKVSFLQIFQHRKLTINLVCMSVIYFVCGMGFYGVSQYIGQMSGNIHLNVAISGGLLIPGTIACAFSLKIFGRRSLLMATSFLSGLFMIIVIAIPANLGWARVIIACICNSFFFMSFIVVFLYGVELFPTSVRNSVLGFLSVLSRLGQIIAPPINALPETVSGGIFGVMAIVGGALCYPLPETKNIELPSSLEDSNSMPRRVSRPEQDDLQINS